jgi:hypothetical protein
MIIYRIKNTVTGEFVLGIFTNKDNVDTLCKEFGYCQPYYTINAYQTRLIETYSVESEHINLTSMPVWEIYCTLAGTSYFGEDASYTGKLGEHRGLNFADACHHFMISEGREDEYDSVANGIKICDEWGKQISVNKFSGYIKKT